MEGFSFGCGLLDATNLTHWSFDAKMRQETVDHFQVHNFEFVQFIIHWRLSELTLENEKTGTGSFIKI